MRRKRKFYGIISVFLLIDTIIELINVCLIGFNARSCTLRGYALTGNQFSCPIPTDSGLVPLP
ncbi:MAG: hypothetical protein UW94_C0016G0013 [Parcubacteria group bacterium GW2011_GWA2_45_14]|nr:MAG: hypothetical protein UW94_C0016G0013 [Parcubacteria group bacterium GW2011_GWA2_45_14]